MGWGSGIRSCDGLEVGYLHDDVCWFEGCETEIDRGLGYACRGIMSLEGVGCGGFFCDEHTYHNCSYVGCEKYDCAEQDDLEECEMCGDSYCFEHRDYHGGFYCHGDAWCRIFRVDPGDYATSESRVQMEDFVHSLRP